VLVGASVEKVVNTDVSPVKVLICVEELDSVSTLVALGSDGIALVAGKVLLGAEVVSDSIAVVWTG
jgi:hypothetical protein